MSTWADACEIASGGSGEIGSTLGPSDDYREGYRGRKIRAAELAGAALRLAGGGRAHVSDASARLKCDEETHWSTRLSPAETKIS